MMKNVIFGILTALVFTISPIHAADLQKGLDAAQSGDYATALKEWKPLAEQGDANAQYNLGVMYDNGQGVTRNYKKAVKWYRRAAKQGYMNAQYNLGEMYHKGVGVAQDYKEAVKWYRRAAEQGYAKAYNNLGVMYENGKGVPQEFALAHMWYSIAVANGYGAASKNRRRVAGVMTSADISKAQSMARECLASDYKNCGF